MADNQTIQRPQLPEDCVFALDIGTRSVIGIVGRQRDALFEVMGAEVREHPQRTMIDGQIEDIRQVARIAGLVKEALEERLDASLTRVNVAAAGRALKTGRAEFEMELSGEPVTGRQVFDLEMGAIARIREQVSEQNEDNLNYYCVGHSVVHYYLDDYPFSTIVGHKGARARADVIATFLPAEVIDSLCAAMAIIGCEISHLTLEPIAAMNAVIPAELRLLNLALVDIGAGTSDIAISENGSVSAYTMATIAGDEITEELIKKYLVDFQTAERMKHEAAAGQEEISYQDILGFEYTVALKELLTTLRPAVETLSCVICEKIREANGKTPAAVFLVGGGSLVPMLCDCVADGLGLDRKKVAVGGNNFIKRVAAGADEVAGPEFATPLGIALTAVAEGSQHGFYLFVNGKKTRLFRNENISVMDALLLCGYRYHQLLGHNGHNITYQFNGQKQILRGGYLTPAQILLNGMESSITAPVSNEDHIDVIPAEDGEDAYLTLTMLEADPFEIAVLMNDMPLKAGREVTVNGEPAEPGQEIHDHDVIVVRETMTLRALCDQLGIAHDAFLLNGEPGALDTVLSDGDRLEPVVRPSVQEVQQTPHILPAEDLNSPDAAASENHDEPDMVCTSVMSPEASGDASSSAENMEAAPETALPTQMKTPPAQAAEQGQLFPREPEKAEIWKEKLEKAWETPVSAPAAVPAPGRQPETAASLSWAERISRAWESPEAPVEQAAVQEELPDSSSSDTIITAAIEEPAQTASAVPVQQTAKTANAQEVSQTAWGFRPGIKITLNGESVWLDPKPHGGYQFLDMLNLVDIDPTKPQGNIVLCLNGRNASYLDDIRNGDTVDIRWESV